MEIPTVEMIAEENKDLAESVNKEIYSLCQEYADGAVSRAMEYKQVFLDTGGTMEEWNAHNLSIKVSYELKSRTDDYLSFLVSGSESWNSAGYEARYYTLDLKEGKRTEWYSGQEKRAALPEFRTQPVFM